MRVLKRVILLLSFIILIGSFFSYSNISEIVDRPKVEKNIINGLPGKNNQILVVKIDDTKPAQPQIGLEEADVVYVEQVESGLTRLAAIYSSKLPLLIGPVRSARISDIELLAQYGRVGFAYSGAQSKLRPVIAAANLENLSAERNPPSIYGKDPNRPAPVNMVLKPDLLLDRANSRQGTVIDKPIKAPWSFGDIKESKITAASVQIKWPNARYELRWDESLQKFLIYFSGEAKLAASGEHLYADTAIVQLVSITPSIYGDKFGGVTPFSKTTGSGKAIMFRDGASYEINWRRDTPEDVTTWQGLDGKVANFKPGRIWVFLTDQQPLIAP